MQLIVPLLYTFSVVLLWAPLHLTLFKRRIPLWLLTITLTISAAIATRLIDPLACIWLAILIGSCHVLSNKNGRPVVRLTAGVLVLAISLALGFHALPGFHAYTQLNGVLHTTDTHAYSLALHLDKAMVGFFILALLVERRHTAYPPGIFKPLSAIFTITALLVFGLALAIGYVRFDAKIPPILVIWIWRNLFFTCVVEEAFFRGLVQQRLAEILNRFRYGNITAVIVTAALFGLAHFGGGWQYVLLSAVAGLGYGLIYLRSGRIEAAIIAHFLLNLIHLTLFSYPKFG